MISPSEIACLRLQNQQISQSRFEMPKQIVHFMGAMQAQHYDMVKWAIGLRLPKATLASVEKDIHQRMLIRTHILRPTWHVVTASDLSWMHPLSAPKIKSTLKARHKRLGLTPDVLKKCFRIIEENLKDSNGKTRDELITALNRGNISTRENNRAAHIFLISELEGLICSGQEREHQFTYALFKERIPKRGSLSRAKAVARLVKTYFMSHGPATEADCSWWAGLPLRDVRGGIECAGKELEFVVSNGLTYWLSAGIRMQEINKEKAYLIPAYDEFIISYKDRSAVLDAKEHKRAVSANGIFRPVVVINGKVAGLWKRILKNDKVIIEVSAFRKYKKQEKTSIAEAVNGYGAFLGQNAEVRF